MKSKIIFAALLLAACATKGEESRTATSSALLPCTHEHAEFLLTNTYYALGLDKDPQAGLPEKTNQELLNEVTLTSAFLEAHKAHDLNDDEKACTILRNIAADKNLDIE